MSIEIKKNIPTRENVVDECCQLFHFLGGVSKVREQTIDGFCQKSFKVDDVGPVRFLLFKNGKSFFLMYDAGILGELKEKIDKKISQLPRHYWVEGNWDKETHDRSFSRLGVYSIKIEDDNSVRLSTNPYGNFDKVFNDHRKDILSFYQETKDLV